MSVLKCIVIDDDELDRLMVVSCVKKFPQLQLLHSFENAEQALQFTDFSEADVLFLDVDMPGLNGIDFRKEITRVPACVFITSYPEYALESFSVDTLDFIVKPLTTERFSQAVERITQFMDIREKASMYENYFGGDHIVIKDGIRETRVNLHEILYLEALKDYTLIVTDQKKHCVLSSIGNLLKEQAFGQFVRIHRSFAVRKDTVKAKNTNELVLHNNMALPIGRTYKENIEWLP